MKPCKLCQEDMNEGSFDYCDKCRIQWKRPKDRYYYLKKRQTDKYRQEASERTQKWIKKHYEQYINSNRILRDKQRLETLSFYANSDIPKCVHCGETNIKILALDHINHDGKQDNANRGGMFGLYRRALKLKDRSKYQTLCCNCNWKKHIINLKSKWKNEKENIRQRAKNHNQKLVCINHYSNNQNKCCKCNNSDIDVLCLDHINNDGNIHRKEVLGKNSGKLYHWAIKNNFPPIFQVLCFNCNILKQRELEQSVY